MKLTNVLKIFGAATVIAGLTPYRVTKDEETGERKVRALFWEATSAPKTEDEEKNVSVHVGFFSPLEKDDDEAHLFADELTVEYSKDDEDETAFAEEDGKDADEELAKEDTAAESPDETVEEDAVEEAPTEREEKEQETESTEEN